MNHGLPLVDREPMHQVSFSFGQTSIEVAERPTDQTRCQKSRFQESYSFVQMEAVSIPLHGRTQSLLPLVTVDF